jgi:hypothetical protein
MHDVIMKEYRPTVNVECGIKMAEAADGRQVGRERKSNLQACLLIAEE